MPDVDDILFALFMVGIFALIIVGVIGACAGISYLSVSTYNGQRYEVTVTVQAVEHSQRWGDHTNLWVQVYGDQDITYTLTGYHDFVIGKSYKIVFVDEVHNVYWILFEAWGNVKSIELQEDS